MLVYQRFLEKGREAQILTANTSIALIPDPALTAFLL